ncbi:MAG: IS30 family transposase [Clostridia bacterium]|nr:IS30 family transposase [Clostridia bacterium]
MAYQGGCHESIQFQISSFESRTIEDCLRNKMTFKAIAKLLGKDQTTISKEIKKHIVSEPNSKTVRDANNVPLQCPQLLRPPFVCNGCNTRYNCQYERRFYRANEAQTSYKSLLSEARTGVALNRQQFYHADDLIAEGLDKGQHIYHICKTNDLGMSISSVYRNINKGYMSSSRIDLPRAVKFKQRKKHTETYVPKGAKVGRSFEDFSRFAEENEICNWVEMDTVIGVPGGKVLVTFDFTICNFMFALLAADKTAGEVSRQIRALKNRLLKHGTSFGELLPVVVTDNGGEFSDFHAFEDDLNGVRESRLFYCDPFRSSQKPFVEKNHTLFRDICPKGTSFNDFTQTDVDLIFSHVNGIKRKKLQGKSPFEQVNYSYGFDLAGLFGITHIPPDDVIQSPRLLSLLNHK